MPRPTCLRTAAAVALAASLAATIPASAIGAKDWLAGSLRVEAEDFSMGDLIALKGAVENADPIRATGILLDAGWYPGIRAYPR